MNMNVCIPTLNAVAEFWKCVESINRSSITCKIFVIDNGFHVNNLVENMIVHKPESNLGVAGSWNYFLDHVPSPRIITNDDIVFDPYAIETLWRAQDSNNLVSPENLDSPFSCFLITDDIVKRVGKFDEWISPKYAYFEDNDYSHRMSMNGIGIIKATGAFVEHAGSSSLKHFDKRQTAEHHDKFRLARSHYVKKWGGEPGHEIYKTPFGR